MSDIIWLQNLQGAPGPQGPIGNDGPQGEQGPQGIKGDTGNVGPVGPIGLTGGFGPQGPKGDRGDVGDVGATGPQGLTGATGQTGAKGDKGDTGNTGPTGSTGAIGPQGAKGDRPAAGIDAVTNVTGTGNGFVASLPAEITTLPNGYVFNLISNRSNTGSSTLTTSFGTFPITSYGLPIGKKAITQGVSTLLFWSAFSNEWNIQTPLHSITLAEKWGVIADGVTDCTAALQNCLDNSGALYIVLPAGPILLLSELILPYAGQFLIGQGSSGLYALILSGLVPPPPTQGTWFVARGSGYQRYIRTKAKYRASASDPQDDPINTVIVNANNFQGLKDLTVYAQFDPTNLSPTYEGDADLDCFIFQDCRVKFSLSNVHLLGHTKKHQRLINATRNNQWNEGTLVSATSTTATLASNASTYNGEHNNCYLRLIKGPGAGPTDYLISNYNSTTKVLTIAGALPAGVNGTTSYIIHGRETVTPANHTTKPSWVYPSTPERGIDGCDVDSRCLFYGCRAGSTDIGAQLAPGFDWYGYKFANAGLMTFTANPAVGESIALAGVTLTFVEESGNSKQVSIGFDIKETIDNLVKVLIYLRDEELVRTGLKTLETGAYYTASTGNKLQIFARLEPEELTGFTLVSNTSNIIPSGPFIVPTVDPAPYYDQIVGALVKDIKGSFGGSDRKENSEDVVDHPSGWLRSDPLWPRNQAIDTFHFPKDFGFVAGNASRTAQNCKIGTKGRVMGMGSCVRVGQYSRLIVEEMHFEWSRAYYTSRGVPLTSNISGTTQSAGAQTIDLQAVHSKVPTVAQAHPSCFNAFNIEMLTGAAVGQTNQINTFDPATNTATLVAPWGIQPAAGDLYKLNITTREWSYGSVVTVPGQQYVGVRLIKNDQPPYPQFFDYLGDGTCDFFRPDGKNFLGGQLTVAKKAIVGRDLTGKEAGKIVVLGGKDASARISVGNRFKEDIAYWRYDFPLHRMGWRHGGSETEGTYASLQITENKSTNDTLYELDCRTISGTVVAGSDSGATLASTASTVDGRYTGMTIDFVNSGGLAQSALISAYNGATRAVTFATTLATPVDSATTYRIDGSVTLVLDGKTNSIQSSTDLDSRCASGKVHTRRIGSTTVEKIDDVFHTIYKTLYPSASLTQTVGNTTRRWLEGWFQTLFFGTGSQSLNGGNVTNPNGAVTSPGISGTRGSFFMSRITGLPWFKLTDTDMTNGWVSMMAIASTTVDGLMTALDKIKLNSVETGATAPFSLTTYADISTGAKTITLNSKTKWVTASVIAGGGGGGSGRRGATMSAKFGGGPGGYGSYRTERIRVEDLPATLTLTPGLGGVGGAAPTTDNTDGADGSSGTPSTITGTGFSFSTQAGTAGGGGTATTGAAGNNQFCNNGGGARNGSSSSVTAQPSTLGPSGMIGCGNAGGGVSVTNVAYNGGNTNAVPDLSAATGGVANTSAGSNGASAATGKPRGGVGGAGGGGNNAGGGFQGGDAGNYGASGGGGGAGLNGFLGGRGGNGAGGIVVILEEG